MTKHFGIRRSYNGGLAIELGKYLGFCVQRHSLADGRAWLCVVIWYPRGRRRLGYLYPQVRYR